MKKIIFWFDDLTAEELKTCIECIARFENLNELKLVFNRNKTTKPIDDCLSLIGQKCNKLLKLDLHITSCLLMSDQFFDIMSEFKSIKKLNICFSQLNEVKGSVECFKHCTELNHLDINCEGLREDFFANIASFVPKLQSLRILTHKRFSDTFINSFQTMKNIQTVTILFDNGRKKIISPKVWYFGKSFAEVMLSPKAKKVIRVNDNCGLIDYNHYDYYYDSDSYHDDSGDNSDDNYNSDEYFDNEDDDLYKFLT